MLSLAGLVFMGGCATQRAAHQGKEAVERQNWDGAVYYYLEALAADPTNIHYKIALIRARQRAAEQHFKRGMALKKLGRMMSARNELQMAVQLDPTHQYAAQELEKVKKDLEILARPNGKETIEEMKKKAGEMKVKPPILNPRSPEPITLSFPKAKPVKEIYRALGKAYGFNVLFDPKLKNPKLSIELRDVSAKEGLEIVMQAAGQFYKVIDPNTIIIADDTPQNRRDYEDLVIKTFFLSNADVKDVDKALRSLIETRRIATDEQLNAITIRDTADKVAIAEKLIKTLDKAKGEVMIDVELLEVNSTKLQKLGTELSTYGVNLNLDNTKVTGSSSADTPIRLNQLSNITNGAWTVTVPNVLINLVKSTTDATSLAEPQMRITDGEKGSLVIGQRTPIPVTSFNTSNTIGGSIVPLTSYQYQDVGIKINVEPRVHHNREITLKVKVEVSQVAGTAEGGLPIIGTRTIDTVIRLKDGETNMLVGLYKEDKTTTKNKIPLLSDIPILGKLFTNTSTNKTTTDLVLTLTPHIIRYPDIEESDLAPMWVGTEKRISYYGNSPRVRSGRGFAGPFGESGVKTRRRFPNQRLRLRRIKPRVSKRIVPVGKRGRSLVPGSGPINAQGLQTTQGTPGSGDAVQPAGEAGGTASQSVGGPAGKALSLSLQPAVISLRPGNTTKIQVVMEGSPGSFHIPVGISYNSRRLKITHIALARGVDELGNQEAPSAGWLNLDLGVAHPDAESAQVVATLTVEALQPGQIPVVLSSQGAMDASGKLLAVSAGQATVFVLRAEGAAGDGS
ncbi:MAG: hypothetical protein GXP48_01500 [Acidobacteria bacterium]|nr:hypothetical protein [Acidobacteriota bacterium]